MFYKLSVLIVTKDRPKLLTNCLNSLKRQTVLPYQVVVVENGQQQKSKKIITQFNKYFKLNLIKEEKMGEAFARNRALSVARGEIFIFIDDDCVVGTNWLEKILLVLKKNPQIDGILGKTESLFRDNIYSCVYQSYYLRWLMENIRDFRKVQLLTKKNSFFDTKNLILKKKIMKDFFFDSNILFNSINVDNLAGEKLLAKGRFLYSPDIIVYHQNPTFFLDLFKKNFIQGLADQYVLERGINIKKRLIKPDFLHWLKVSSLQLEKLPFLKKLIFWMIWFIYPLPYKIGRICYKWKLLKTNIYK